jgi:von Willebrand factor A domain-containing protein 7
LIGLIGLIGLLAGQQQQPQSRPGWPCVGRPDPSMVQVSEGSGGQVFLLDPSEIASSATLLMARQGHDETLRRVVGELEPGVRTVDVHVDTSVAHVLFSVSLQCLQGIEIVRPSGTPVAASDLGVTWTAFQAGRQVGVDRPEAGVWKVQLAGKGLLFLVIHARASLALDDVRPVRAGGRPGHEGLFRDDAPLVPGTLRLMEIRLSPGILGPTFEMRSSEDTPLGTLPTARQQASEDEQVHLSEFLVPSTPFRVVVTGRDAAGNTVQRAQSSLFQLSQTR